MLSLFSTISASGRGYWAVAAVLLCGNSAGLAGPPISFNRDVRPILADHCFACHGPDKNARKADLRLDVEEDARADRGGYRAITPGKVSESELISRINSHDPAQRMPPAKFGKPLSKEQIATLTQWIDSGAKWEKHWSRITPERPSLPDCRTGTPGQAIDRFVLANLERNGLGFSPPADRTTLLRRLSFDLTGLPPTPKEVDAFLHDQLPGAVERQIDRLLASNHFGERMALYWLDLVRYADTAGYHSDNHRDVSLFRDYVIAAFNDNKPFDRFTTEQLAGDLLPNPTHETRVASGYNRLLQTTEEGGAQPKEYIAKYAADRVRNASSVWLGATLGCCECHDHKFDPYPTREFYRFAAFFADIQEKPVGRQDQTQLLSKEQSAQLASFDARMTPLQKKMTEPAETVDAAQKVWESKLDAAALKKLPKPVSAALAVEVTKRTGAQRQTIQQHYRSQCAELATVRAELVGLQTRKAELERTVPTTLVASAMKPRDVRVLPRGNWLDETGEIVTPGVPSAIASFTPTKPQANRLDLANWMMSKQNPVVARVFVNRLWKLFFGQGLVTTAEDFGSQGAWPTHPELLDWLAVEFRESGWDVKHMIRLMLKTRAYQQTSVANAELRQKDPYNRLLGRQSSFRLDAEMVRDNALAVSGLLSEKVGGPSVKPYQPAGYWSYLNFPKREWQNSDNEDLYRRGLYTYWCRTFLHPSLAAFDAPSREECTVDRSRSNTPVQALVLLNDPTYVEAARAFAQRTLQQPGLTSSSLKLKFMIREALSRDPRPEETKLLMALLAKHTHEYQADGNAAKELEKIGKKPLPKDVDVAELAAWTSVARVILNLHETITRN
ncbi:DUF1553 domain-containing protein [soil metagenome]